MQGKAKMYPPPPFKTTDHPCACREKIGATITLETFPGSSLRMQGKALNNRENRQAINVSSVVVRRDALSGAKTGRTGGGSSSQYTAVSRF